MNSVRSSQTTTDRLDHFTDAELSILWRALFLSDDRFKGPDVDTHSRLAREVELELDVRDHDGSRRKIASSCANPRPRADPAISRARRDSPRSAGRSAPERVGDRVSMR